MQIGGRAALDLRALRGGPVGVPRLFVEVRDRLVQPTDQQRALQGPAIDGKRRREFVLRHRDVGDDQLEQRRVGRRRLERVERRLGDPLVTPGHPVPGARVVGLEPGQRAVLGGGVGELRKGEVRARQHVACVRVVGHRGHRLAERRHRVLHAPGVEERAAEEERCRRERRVERERLLERADGLRMPACHVARHPEIQEQAGILRPLLHQFAVDRRGFVKVRRPECRRTLSGACGKRVGGLRRHRRGHARPRPRGELPRHVYDVQDSSRLHLNFVSSRSIESANSRCPRSRARSRASIAYRFPSSSRPARTSAVAARTGSGRDRDVPTTSGARVPRSPQ